MKALTLRLCEAEYEELRSFATGEDRSMSAVIREYIHEYIPYGASRDALLDSLEQDMSENPHLFAGLPRH